MSKTKSDADDFFGNLLEDAPEEEPIAEDEGFEEDFEEDDEIDNEALPEEEADSEEPLKGDKDDPKGKRFAYWQQQADKQKNINKQLEAKLQELKAVAPIAEFLRDNPQALDSIENFAKGKSPAQQEVSFQKPEPPKRPSNFSFLDAEENPDGPSGRYLQEREAYQDKLLDFYAQREEVRSKQLESTYKEQNQRAVKAQRQLELNAQLQNEYDMSVAEANAFIAEMDAPNSLTLETLVDYWKFKHSDKSSDDSEENEKTREIKERARRRGTPPPPKGGGGSGEKDIASDFVADLKRTGRNLFETKQK